MSVSICGENFTWANIQGTTFMKFQAEKKCNLMLFEQKNFAFMQFFNLRTTLY